MARHSKNNTAGSVFTYGERLKLKQSNEWGEIHQRIGTDSHKKFEQCNLCLKLLDEPMCCPKGHMFCKNCIIENLVIQKNEIKKKLKAWKEKKEEDVKQEQINTDKNNQILVDNFKRVEDGIEDIDFDSKPEELLALPDDKVERFKMIEELKKKKDNLPIKEKSELIKNCFWIPEKTPDADKKEANKPDEKLYCPVNDKNHTIRLKELIRVNMQKNEAADKYICTTCNKEIAFQKVVLLKKCGHITCKKCMETLAKKDQQCLTCFESFYPSDVINLQETGTAFSIHNKVETVKLNPHFKY